MFGAAEFACPLRPHVGERTTAPAIAPARSPPLALNGQQLAAPEWVFEAIPEPTKLTGGNGAQRNCRPVQRLVGR